MGYCRLLVINILVKIMHLKNLTPFLGLDQYDSKLIDALREWGVDISIELFLLPERYSAYIERPDQGFSVIFTDEAKFKGIGDQALGQGGLFFSGIFLYAQGQDDYDQYQGALPFELSFDLHATDIARQLGKPSWRSQHSSEGWVGGERWDQLADYQLHISYHKDTQKPRIITLQIPDDVIN